MRLAISLFVLVLAVSAVPAQEPPAGIIERAIAAHGGRAKLAGARSERLELTGTIQVGASAVPFTNSLAVQLPSQYRSNVRIQQGNRQHTIVHLLDGDRAAIYLDGQPQPASGANIAQLRQTLQLEQAMRLVALLDDPSYSLHPLPDVRYNDRVLAGVRVKGPGQRDLKLYFDRPSGLLVKSEMALDGPGGKDVLQEALYGEYREVGGHLRPTKVIVLRDGKKVMEAAVSQAQRVERIDPVEFNRP